MINSFEEMHKLLHAVTTPAPSRMFAGVSFIGWMWILALLVVIIVVACVLRCTCFNEDGKKKVQPKEVKVAAPSAKDSRLHRRRPHTIIEMEPFINGTLDASST